MCLALPAKIEEKHDVEAWVRIGDARMKVNLIMTPEAEIGDWVLVHAGFAIQQVSDDEARETWMIIEENEILKPPKSTAEEERVRSWHDHETRIDNLSS